MAKWMYREALCRAHFLTIKTYLGGTELIAIVTKQQRTCVVVTSELVTTEMGAPMKFVFVIGLLLVVSIVGVDGATNPCGKTSPDNEAMKLAPCAEAAQDEKAAVSNSCCLQVKRIGQNPNCLCAVLLSNTAKSSGVEPEVAITIPKRCNFANRPVGYKCGPYTLP